MPKILPFHPHTPPPLGKGHLKGEKTKKKGKQTKQHHSSRILTLILKIIEGSLVKVKMLLLTYRVGHEMMTVFLLFQTPNIDSCITCDWELQEDLETLSNVCT